VAAPPPTLLTCRSIADNNIRSGPGTEYEVIAKTQADVRYAVFQRQTTTSGTTLGEWFNIRWGDGAGDAATQSGWIWADLLSDCTPS
jgi:uncharacterized protein YraI